MRLEDVDKIIQARIISLGSDKLEEWKREFESRGVANVKDLLPDGLFRVLSDEAVGIAASHGVERDITIAETNHSPRRMVTVNNARCREAGDLIPKIYDSVSFRALLSEIACEPVHTCPNIDEQLAITLLTEPGNTHGWHWDYYSFGLVWIVESPDPSLGGFVQLIPNTKWDQESPNVMRTILDNPIHSYSFPIGSFYFFRSSTTLHRVHPLMERTRRLIINMEWASDSDLVSSIDTPLTSLFFGDSEIGP
jgi:L-lysine 4-chlorinase